MSSNTNASYYPIIRLIGHIYQKISVQPIKDLRKMNLLDKVRIQAQRWGYWSNADNHGFDLTKEQAAQLLKMVLGGKITIK